MTLTPSVFYIETAEEYAKLEERNKVLELCWKIRDEKTDGWWRWPHFVYRIDYELMDEICPDCGKPLREHSIKEALDEYYTRQTLNRDTTSSLKVAGTA